ncbi:MAG: hypothetical protein IPO98_20925 [Saprospiraceae bacterium]|nr:hypothetical protein [Saprospiraceae bacterium]
MQQNHSLFTIFTLIGVSHCIFLIVFIGKDLRSIDISKKLFLVILMAYSVRMTKWVCNYLPSEYFILYNNLCYSFQTMLGPLVYFYTYSFLDDTFVLRKKHVLHFLPVFLLLFIDIGNSQSEWMQKLTIILPLITVFWSIYIVLSFLHLFKNRIKLASMFEKDQKWILAFLVGNLIMVISYIIYLVLDEPGQNFFSVTFLLISIALSFLYMHFQNGYSKSISRSKTLHADMQSKLSGDINQLMVQKIYLDTALNMPKMATLLKTSPHTLSQFINDHYQQNFSEFINNHRIQEAAVMAFFR